MEESLHSCQQLQLAPSPISMLELVVRQPNQQVEDLLMVQLQLVARCLVLHLLQEEVHSQVV